MTDHCENIKSQLEGMLGKGLSDKAKLVALLEACGISDREEVERLLECKPSTLRAARQTLKFQRQDSSTARNPAPEIQRERQNSSDAPEIKRQNSSDASRAHATKESFQDTHTNIVRFIPQTPLEAGERVRFADGRLELCQELWNFWLKEFKGDEPRLRLALIEAGGSIQRNSSTPLEAQVGRKLARIAGERHDRSANYAAAVARNSSQQPQRKPKFDLSSMVEEHAS